ncbi:MAG TPA: DUF5916 domain-containing protein [Gemmatimonadaceae bacterium]|nr:DUF5916 domain-containing protein [Gemmatimonadaceae bacterium]
MIGRVVRLALAAVVLGRPLGAQDSTANREVPSTNSITARDVLTAPPMDRGMDAVAWRAADSITDFRQRDPSEGAPGSEHTVVKVLHDHDALYIAVRAWDRDARRIRATQLRRDADLSSDDNVTILIDSFHDRRSAYLFQTNPNGARWDAQITTQETNQDWNGIWYVTASRDSTGWTAMFRIPFRTLRFSAGAGAAFGFNVRRYIRRKNEEDLWRGWRRTEGLDQLLTEGELLGLGGVSRARDIELEPYVLASAHQAPHDSVLATTGGAGVSGKVGIDAKLAVSPTLTADLTVNTDFAQVEVDSQVINLTRFPTFFPEKRDFFLESSGIFEFGFNQKALLFYSRRIGLTDSGTVAPILAGARLYGRAGPWSIGFIDARTGGDENDNDAVVRVKHDLFARSYVGAMATLRTGPNGREVAEGFDADFPLVVGGQNIEPTVWVAGTQTPHAPGTQVAWRIATDFPNDLFDNFVGLARYDAGFAPALGFVSRTGAWETYGHVDVMPRPHVLGIRQLEFELPSWDIYANHDGSLVHARDWQNATIEWHPLGAVFESGDQFQVMIVRDMDAPTDPFTIARGVSIAAGRYWWTQAGAQFQTSLGRTLGGFGLVSTGTFYDGRSTETDGGVTWRSGGHLILGASLSRTDVTLPVGHFVAVQSAGRVEYAFTTRMDFLGFAQYETALARTDFDLRFHWAPVIGDDVYVVWNSGYTNDPLSSFRFPSSRALARPLTATFTVKYVHRIAP